MASLASLTTPMLTAMRLTDIQFQAIVAKFLWRKLDMWKAYLRKITAERPISIEKEYHVFIASYQKFWIILSNFEEKRWAKGDFNLFTRRYDYYCEGTYWPAWIVEKSKVADLELIPSLLNRRTRTIKREGVHLLERYWKDDTSLVITTLQKLGYWRDPAIPHGTQVKRIAFQILPPAEAIILIQKARQESKDSGKLKTTSSYYERLEFLQKLGQPQWWVGFNPLNGEREYIVAEYPNWVVAECPLYGNAIYACRNLGEESWQKILTLSKPKAQKEGAIVIRHTKGYESRLTALICG